MITGWEHIGAGVRRNRFSPVPEIESRFLGHSAPTVVPHPSSDPHNRMNQVTQYRSSKLHWMCRMTGNASLLTPSKEMTSTLLFIKTVAGYKQYTGFFKMIVGVLTTCHTQYTWDMSTRLFYLIEQHSEFLLHTLQVLYIRTFCVSTNINTIIEFVPNCL